MKPRILIVDDEKLFLESLVEHLRLKRDDMVFYSTTSPVEAIGILKRKNIDVVVMDVRMPEMSGLDLFMHIKKNYPHVKTIVMTAYGSEDLERKVMQEGGTRYITKPFSPENFEQVLQEVVNDAMDFKGVLAGFSLMDILQLIHVGGHSAVVYVKLGKNTGKIWLKDGEIIHATCSLNGKTFVGTSALNTLLQWNQGEILTLPFEEPLKRTITGDFDFLILNALKEIDETKREFEEKEKDETNNILSTEKGNLAQLEERYGETLYGVWIINANGKVIHAKIYNNGVYEIKGKVFKEIKKQFTRWKRGELLFKEQIISEDPPLVFKILFSGERYLICAVYAFKEEFEMIKNKKGGETMPGQKEIEKALELLSGIEGGEGAAVVSNEGLVLEARLDRKYNPEKFGALISVALEAAEKVVKEAGWGDADNMVVEGTEGKMVIYSVPMGFIVLLGKKNMNLGYARMQVDQASEILGA